MNDIVKLKTSDKGWLSRLAEAYKNKEPIILIDDAAVGINPKSHTILAMGKKAGLSASEWVGILVSLGMTALGAWMILAAILDPDPTSKLGLLIAGGSIIALTGGLSAIRILTKQKPPKIKGGKDGFEIQWE